jgi:hypothetical protein
MGTGHFLTAKLAVEEVDVAEAEVRKQHPEEPYPRERAIARLTHLKHGKPKHKKALLVGLVLLGVLLLSLKLYGQTTSVDIKRVGGTLVTSPLPVTGTFTPGGTQDINFLQFLGVTPTNTNPVPVRLTNGTVYFDARDRNWSLNSATDSVTIAGSIANTTFAATQGTSPWVVSVPTWAGGTLGAMANYGTSPGAVLVPGVNAFITNVPHVITDSGSVGSITFASPQHTIVDSGTITAVTSITNQVDTNIKLVAGANATAGDVNNAAAIAGSLNTAPVARYNATQPTLTDTRYNQFQLSSRGELLVLPGTSGFPITFSSPQHTILDSGTLTSITNKVGVTGVDGDVFVRCNAASTCPVNATQVTSPWVVSGAVTTSGTATVIGTLTTNNAAPAGTNVGVLPAVANAAQKSYTEADQVLLSTDLKGSQRTRIQDAAGNDRGVNVDASNRLTIDNTSWIGSTAPTVGSKTAANSLPVVIASDQASIPVAATLNAETTKVIGTVRAQGNLGAAMDAATGAAPPANAILAGGITSGATGGFMAGIPICDSQQAVNISTITTTLIVTGVSGRHIRICAFQLVTAAANNVAWLSGTGATCGTGTAGISGGTTAASGYNFAANGGLTAGSGLGTVLKTAATGDSICLVTSATTQLSGTVSYTIY